MHAPSKYWFNQWIYGCISSGHLILLDVRRDQYFFIDQSEISDLARCVAISVPASIEAKSESGGLRDISPTIKEMLKSRVITNRADKGKALELCLVEPTINPFEHVECDDPPRATLGYAVVAFIAGLLALTALKFLPLNLILDRYRIRRSTQAACDADTALRLARIYKQLRPVLIKNRICLFDTLSFVLFCHFFKVYPKLVIGVIGEPFQAHCWAQVNGYILNDVPQNTNQYTPIMAV